MKKYWNYFWYVVEHKWNVFIECLYISQPLHGILHDMSKFLPSEFIPYARYFKGDGKNKDTFDIAWLLHQHRNKHHWDYWVKSDGHPVPMPSRYIMQMVADWRAMSRKFGGSWYDFYGKNKDGMVLHEDTIALIEYVYLNQGY